jgi:hypothetical protein
MKEGVTAIAGCAECGAEWFPNDETRWSAYLGSDDLDARQFCASRRQSRAVPSGFERYEAS